MKESNKSQKYWGNLEKIVTQGKGIDIGCGDDPVNSDVRCFDLENGDANCISKYVHEQFDFVYASHCLEHMHDPRATILDWWKLVKPDGYLFVVVPDEDLYEQGVFPSRFNDDHKATFTISKAQSWSSNSINVLDLGNSLPCGQIISLVLQDHRFDRSLVSFGNTQPSFIIRIVAKLLPFFNKVIGNNTKVGLNRLMSTYFPCDQTSSSNYAQAQIQLIVKKTNI